MPRSPELPCAGCGTLLWRSSTSLPAGEARCQPCRRNDHGRTAYGKGCRCGTCKETRASEMRAYRALVRERDGVSLSSKRKSATRFYWIATAVRQAVYARDQWTCQLCQEPVDPSLDPNSRFAATLDHVECRSWALVPDNSPDNLRLAHRACNSRRRDRADA